MVRLVFVLRLHGILIVLSRKMGINSKSLLRLRGFSLKF